MSRHVPPHRFADAAAGRLPARAIERDEDHAAGCARCAGARDRVLASREAMAEVADATPPELGWDHIGARIHWSTSRQQRAVARRGRRDRDREPGRCRAPAGGHPGARPGARRAGRRHR